MATTRQRLNEAALGCAQLLGMVRGMTDDKIDEIMDHDEVERLRDAVQDLVAYAETEKGMLDE